MKIFSWGKDESDIGEGAVSPDGQTGYIDNIRVGQKGRGTGTQILLDLEDKLREQGVSQIEGIIGQFDDTDPEALRRFYEKNGYTIGDLDGIPTIQKTAK